MKKLITSLANQSVKQAEEKTGKKILKKLTYHLQKMEMVELVLNLK